MFVLSVFDRKWNLGILGLIGISSIGTAYADDSCEWIRQKLKEGGTIQVPAGTYECASPLILNVDGTSLEGAGSDKTFFILKNHANSPVIILGDTAAVPRPTHHLSASGFTSDGNLANQDWECWGSATCSGSEQAQIRNNAITIRGASDVEVTNVVLKNARSGGMVTERVCRNLHVQFMESYGNYYDGFAGYLTEDSVFEDISLHDNVHGSGISLDLQFNKNRFSRFHAFNNHDNGIFMRSSNENMFEDSFIDTNGNWGIFATWSEQPGSGVSRNIYKNLDITESKTGGIFLDGPECLDNQLIDSTIENNNGRDIKTTPEALKVIKTSQ